ncbi:MAG TPA: hypothetical protein P5120_09895 [Spirochaetota bacterium]|nr:hypothetical protein [Spirochaetota bacterium]HPJ43067.1 hypothetical protein [Spirochaetota bacterium]HPR37892.1 hypothetical protein [Spirochaetota bacterium]HRX47819.1 hypothetical protein [Spirochaetota bacterium]
MKLLNRTGFICSSAAVILLFLSSSVLKADIFQNEYPIEYRYRYTGASIKTVNGKFYAYIVLLFNENPHFVNLIQKGTISMKEIGNEGFSVKAYRNYLSTIQEPKLLEDAELILKVFLGPDNFNDIRLKQIEDALVRRNIVLRFYREGYYKGARLSLDYCIYGEKIKIDITHPFLEKTDEMYYIKPYIYYDEFSTSNSTFYHDMIYINPDEVYNDYIIAKNIINGKDYKTMFFVGSKVTEDIKYCINMAFKNKTSIREEIWRMFVIHELTHKYLNNKLNNFDQVTGEELSLSSTIYANPYLGMSVMYSYLNYGSLNPHRMAAMNYITFLAENSGNSDLLKNHGLIKNIPYDKIRELTKNHFYHCISKLKNRR